LIAIGNSGDLSFADTVVARLQDENPLVRGAAVWALGQLDQERFSAEKEAYVETEEDPDVRAEWATPP